MQTTTSHSVSLRDLSANETRMHANRDRGFLSCIILNGIRNIKPQLVKMPRIVGMTQDLNVVT